MERSGIGANKAILSRFPLSEKKASSSASDPHLPISLLYPNFLPVSLDLFTRFGFGGVLGLRKASSSASDASNPISLLPGT
jgi:hypothetical protein